MPGLFNEGPPHARVSISQDVFHPQIASPTAVRKVLAELVRKKSREIPREIPSKGPSGPETSKTGVGSAKNGWRTSVPPNSVTSQVSQFGENQLIFSE